MIYQARPGQVSYGEAIGILLLDSSAPYIPGDVANATSYNFPVRFKKVPGLTVERIFNHDLSLLDGVIAAAYDLKNNGVRAVTGDCGFMAIYQKSLAKEIDLPVFMSSLLQVPFISLLHGEKDKIGILTANAAALNRNVLKSCGADLPQRTVIRGLEKQPCFRSAFIDETGQLDRDKVEAEVVSTVLQMVQSDPALKALLLECSVLPPYGAAIQQAVGLPVFDYVTMINYVYSAVVKQRFNGFM